MRVPHPLRWWLPGRRRGGGGASAASTVVASAGAPPAPVPPTAPLNVVITGGTSGVGLALARAFLAAGDRVVLCARTADRVDAVVAALHREAVAADAAAAAAAANDGGAAPPPPPARRVWGTPADVADPAAVDALVAYAARVLPRLDVWINNAGTVGGTRAPLTALAADEVAACVATNLTGSLLCSRAAAVAMGGQSPPGGLVYLMEGAGSAGGATAGYAAYGATKRALPQLAASLAKELSAAAAAGERLAGVRVGLLSPGMVLTPLLLRGSTVPFRRFFNLLAEEPPTVAAALVPRLRAAALGGAGLRGWGGGGRAPAVRFLGGAAAVAQLVWGGVLGVRRGRYFDAEGRRVLREGETREDFDELGVRVERL